MKKTRYKRAFPRKFRAFLCISNAILTIGYPLVAVLLTLHTPDEEPGWPELGRWLTGTIVTSFVALIAAYVWMLPRIKNWPDGRFNVVSYPFVAGGAMLLIAMIVLALNPLLTSEYWPALGIASALMSVAFQVVAVLTVVRFWEERRNTLN